MTDEELEKRLVRIEAAIGDLQANCRQMFGYAPYPAADFIDAYEFVPDPPAADAAKGQ